MYVLFISQMKYQVAAQEGAYLANCFNRMEKCEKNPEGPLRFRGEGRHRFHPFRYKLNLCFCWVRVLSFSGIILYNWMRPNCGLFITNVLLST